jgi:hypothetical protein
MQREDIFHPDMVSDEIHHSLADADDIEEVWDPEISVADVFRNLLHHPVQLVTRWNWKAVLLAMIVRAFFYLIVYVISGESWNAIFAAVAVEMFFRFITTGLAGAAVQSFRKAKPVWLANVIVSILLPAFSHTVEFIAHYVQDNYFADVLAASQNNGRQRTFAISVLFSVVSVLFNLYAMRNGVLLVGAGEETQSLGKDLRQIPWLLCEFTASLPVLIAKFYDSGRYLNAVGAVFAFGFTVGTILGTFRGKWQWAYRGALGAWAILIPISILAIFVRRYVNGRRAEQAEG